jgi:hypothetical protein
VLGEGLDLAIQDFHDEYSWLIVLFIVVDCHFFELSSMEGSYGYALDVMESCCFEG